MLRLLGAARRAFERAALMRAGRCRGWAPKQLLGIELDDAPIGIVGLGRISRAVARRARGFGMRSHYHARNRQAPEVEQGAVYHTTLHSLLPQARFLSLHCLSAPERHHMINARTLAMLPHNAVLVNTARGALLDHDAVLAALDEGQLLAVGPDGFANEPNHPAQLLSPATSGQREAQDARGHGLSLPGRHRSRPERRAGARRLNLKPAVAPVAAA